MRIVQVNTSDLGGGSQVISSRLHDGYRALGHDARIVVGFKRGENPDVVQLPNDPRRSAGARQAMRIGARVGNSRIPYGQLIGHWLPYAGQPRRLTSLLRGHEDFDYPATRDMLDLLPWEPDVAHIHNLHGGYFDLRALPALTQRLPTICTLHDAWLLSGHCAHSFGCERWRTGCGECPDLRVYPAVLRDATHRNFVRKQAIYDRSRLYVATPSRWLARRAGESMLARAMLAEPRVIPNGVDLDVFRPGSTAAARAELGIDPDVFVSLFAANFTRGNPFKDVATLERAFEIVGTRTSERLILLCIGEEAPTRRAGQAEIRFLPHVGTPERLVRWYQAADVYLHAARADTFPNTIIEAMACGTPVIATAVGGIPEQIEDGRTGHLVPAGDGEAMADRLLELAADPVDCATMGRAAADHAREHFDFRRTVAAYTAWFEEMTTGA